jgi:predicted TIM-barrel fold metal-dependent hydrolase
MGTMDAAVPELYVSADSHVVEPRDLWVTRLDRRWRDRAPRIESRPDADYGIIDGLTPAPVGLTGALMNDKIKGEIKDRGGKRHEETRPGGWDPQARIADQQLDHIRAEMLYPGMGLGILGAPDPEYQLACFQVYNDWLAEFCAVSPDRLAGAGVLPAKGPIAAMLKEAGRAVKMGLKSLMVAAEVPERPYSSPEYDPLWAALSELGVPLSIHSGTSSGMQVNERLKTFGIYGVHVVDNKIGKGMRLIAQMIYGGVTERFPNLRLVYVEGGIGWIAGVLHFMDHWWADHRRWMEPRIHDKPSNYFKRNFWATFEDDRAGVLTRELLNIDHLMWGSDYPHTEGTFPHSREQVEHDFAGIPAADVCKMVADNAAQLYGFAA